MSKEIFSPTTPDFSNGFRLDSIQRSCEEWDKAHQRMKARMPKDGASYVRHARNLLPLVEAVFVTFKAVIEFQNELVENSLRIEAILFSQCQLMRFIIDIVNVIQERGDKSLLNPGQPLHEIFCRIGDKIKECGNAIDAYIKEHRIVRALKSIEWKDCLTKLNQDFVALQSALQSALAVDALRDRAESNRKLELLVTRALTPQQEWEKGLQMRVKELGPTSGWMDKAEEVQKLIDETQATTDVDAMTKPGSAAATQSLVEAEKQRMRIVVRGLVEEIDSPLDVLLRRNSENFENKLELQTKRLEDSITASANYVVHQLQGPHNRLNHEASADLKKLWKEMNWIFCVKNKLFAIALYEYYLDHFHSQASPLTAPTIENMDGGPFSGNSEMLQKRREDIWTLEYLANYGKEISVAVDKDQSGFIRISEVNAFTKQIPMGWSLPTWCAYVAVGWEYELHIYQKRVQHLLDLFFEAQIRVLPDNRYWLLVFSVYFDLPERLARGPRKSDFSKLPEALLVRVRSKVANQDERMRDTWKKFGYNIDGKGIVSMLYPNQALESYVLQVCMIFMEHILDVVHLCETEIVDYRDWLRIDQRWDSLRVLVHSRISVLKDESAKKGLEVEDFIEDHYGGIFRAYWKSLKGLSEPWTPEEINQRLTDHGIIQDFSPPSPNTNTNDILKHKTWKEFRDESNNLGTEVPGVLPHSWGSAVPDELQGPRDPPPVSHHINTFCDNCGQGETISTAACFHCCECKDYDLCSNCFELPFHELDSERTANHAPNHNMIKAILNYPYPYKTWTVALGRVKQEYSSGEHWIVNHNREESEQETLRPDVCGVCKEDISGERYFECVHRDCQNYYLCSVCHNSMPGGKGAAAEEKGQHQWWHPLVALKVDPDVDSAGNRSEGGDASVSGETMIEPENEKVLSQDDRIAGLEARIGTLESRVESIHAHVMEVKELIGKMMLRLP
ncbi:hypothetical protein FA15DRAFT_705679 [Coprinopsis marcescibilis]|uniref:ZZ-type domain-containing protein n=1 Tax=Coprinopsis marcescibilis TaxID=230819 RepID=A0A5C3KTQ3_COPMA|nr:hypothetical protein FA15DRAFT_705679 [Coprinopsis marcescibilis]